MCCASSANANDALPEVQVSDSALPLLGHITTYDRSELLGQGDSNLSEVLRRLPGVSVDSEGNIALRGMGQGRTQVLLNDRPLGISEGEVSIEHLSTAMIERVEIIRGASAHTSGTAVAGTIRIITRRAEQTPERTARVRMGFTPGGQFEHSASLDTGGHSAQWQWQVAAEVAQRERVQQRHTDYRSSGQRDVTDNNGNPLRIDVAAEQSLKLRSAQRLRQANVAGEVHLQATAHDRIGVQWHASLAPESYSDTETRAFEMRNNWGYIHNNGHVSHAQSSHSPNWQLSPTLHWERKFDQGHQLRAEWGTEQSRSTERYQDERVEFWQDNAGPLSMYTNQFQEHVVFRERTPHAALHWQQVLSHTQRLHIGTSWRQERLNARFTEGSDVWDEPQTRETSAGYVQWRWQPSAQWSLETGLRHERITQTIAEDYGLPRRAEHLWLPSLNLSYQPEHGPRWHLNVAKTYRPPVLRDMLSEVRERGGDLQNPDLAGNPMLRNETSSGVELGLTHTLQRNGRNAGEAYANLFARRINNSLVHELQPYFNTDWNAERWMLTPVNRGSTRVLGLETGVRYDLAQWPVAVHADLVLTQSRVAGQAAPARLHGQTPLQLNAGWTARTQGQHGLPDQWGAQLRYESGYSTRLNPALPADVRAMTSVHLHALWKLSPDVRLRAQFNQSSSWRTTAYAQNTPLESTRIHMWGDRPWQAALQLERDF